MAKYYLVVEEGYEYNDEYYYKSESGGYTIETNLIKNKEEAQKLASLKNKESESQDWFTDDDGNPITPYKVIEIDDEEIPWVPGTKKPAPYKTVEPLKEQLDFNLDLLTKELFETTFHDISSNYSNNEKLEDVRLERTESILSILFNVDCGRYGLHRNNIIRVYKNGEIRPDLAEHIEGGDLEGQLKRRLKKLLLEQ